MKSLINSACLPVLPHFEEEEEEEEEDIPGPLVETDSCLVLLVFSQAVGAS